MTDEKIMSTIKPDGEYWQPELETMPREQLEQLQVNVLFLGVVPGLRKRLVAVTQGDIVKEGLSCISFVHFFISLPAPLRRKVLFPVQK